MDDGLDDFVSLTMTGIPSKSRSNDVSLSQTNISRLSRSYAKIKKKSVPACQSTSVDNQCANSARESIVTTVGKNQHKDSHHASVNGLQFCPLCQAPFDIIKIHPQIHVNRCTIPDSELKECAKGELCYNEDCNHYQQYAHTVLAKMRSSKGHLQHETLQYVTSKKEKITSHEGQLFSIPSSTLNGKNKVKKTSIDDVRGHVSAHQNKQINGEQTHTLRRDESVSTVLKNGHKSSAKPEVHKYNLNESDAGTGHTRIVNCGTGDKNLRTCVSDKRIDDIRMSKIKGGKQGTLSNGRISKAHKFCDESVKSAEFEGSKSDISTTCEKNGGKCKERSCAGHCNSECNHELKLHATVEYTTGKLKKLCPGNRNILARVLPCKVVSDSGCLDTVRATMSLVLSPSKEHLHDGGDKIKTPVKMDASCSELGWETVGIAALPGAEVHDVTVSVSTCNKTMELKCSLSHDHTVTNVLDKTGTKTAELESKFLTNVKELGLSHKSHKKEAVGAPHHQMSLTSYFQSSRHSSSRSQNIPTKNVKSTNSSFPPSQDSHCLKSCDLNTTLQNHNGHSSEAQKQSKESVLAYWKQRLDGMRQRGLSTMSVMSDDTLTVTSDGFTSASNSHSSQKSVGKKTCPTYKRIPGTSFVVDAFQYGIIPGITHYFLSHFHSDHYGGLRRSFSEPIYCSKITAALVKMKLLVDEQHLRVLDLDVPRKINGVLVTALDANHCPGSVMFLFQLQNGQNHLHVGDFRADPKMESYPCFWNLAVDKLFLDTTYCEPRYTFPLQSETVQRVVELAVGHNRRAPSTLFMCGTYTLGKEKVFLGIVEALNCKLWASDEKRKVLECLDNQIITDRLTKRQWDAQVHVCRMSDLNINFLQHYLKQHEGIFTHIVAFIPTGWEMSRKSKTFDSVRTDSYGNITIYGIPYSEHSSFGELRRFVQFLKPAEIIPTVNVANHAKRNAMAKYFKQWLSEPSVSPLKRKTVGDVYVQQKITRYLKP